MPAPYPAEFKRRAVELARQGDKPIAQLARWASEHPRHAHVAASLDKHLQAITRARA